MPASTFKVIFFFENDEQSLGWSEVNYFTGADILAAQTAGLALAQARVALLAGPIQLKYIRCSGNLPPTTAHTYRQRLANLTAPLLVGSWSPGTDYPDVTWTAAKVRLTNNDGTIFRVQLLRGIPDIIWDQGTDKLGKVRVQTFMKSYVKALIANNFSIAHTIRGNPNKNFVAIAAGFYEGLTRRATGRPSYLPRGRRSPRA
jgi:hypothetical protein